MNSVKVTPQDYYTAMSVILKTIIETIVEKSNGIDVETKNLTGRNGSTYFEDEFLKPLIREFDEHYSTVVNDALRVHDLDHIRFIRIDASENIDESSARTMEDVSVYIEFNNEIHQERINVKATNGQGYDNVGGWEGFAYAIYGDQEDTIKNEQTFVNKIQSGIIIDNELHDYFLWVFNKSFDNGTEIIESHEVHSLLSTSLNSFTVNMSQSFPLQFKSSKATAIDYSKTTVAQTKTAMISKIFTKSYEHSAKKAKKSKSVLDFLTAVVSLFVFNV